MLFTRIITGLAAGIFVTIPLIGLGRLSYDIRYLDFDEMYREIGFPELSSLLWVFGPLDWWSFITPLALAVAVAASIRKPLQPSTLGLILGSIVLQALALIAAGTPYFKLMQVMGYPIPRPYPILPLMANLSLVGTAVGIAIYSLARARARAQSTLL